MSLVSRFTLRCYERRAGITREELRRVMSETGDEAFEEITEDMRRINQRLASLEQDARQPRIAMESDVKADKKTRVRTEGAAAAVQAKHGDSCSAKRAQAGSKRSTSFSDDSTKPPALPRSRNDALVGNGATAPKSCFSLLEMGTPTVAGGLLPTGKTSTATMSIFQQLPLGFCLTKEIKSRTSNHYAIVNSSFWKLKVIETKSGQTLLFDPGGSTDQLRTWPFLGTWRALLCGEVSVRALDEAAAFFD